MFGYFSFEIKLCLAAISRLKSEDSLICRNGYAVKNIMQKYSIQLPFGHFKAARALFREIFSYNFIFLSRVSEIYAQQTGYSGKNRIPYMTAVTMQTSVITAHR